MSERGDDLAYSRSIIGIVRTKPTLNINKQTFMNPDNIFRQLQYFLLTNLLWKLSSWSRLRIIENVTVTQMINNGSIFYKSRKFITVFTPLHPVRGNLSPYPHIFLRSINFFFWVKVYSIRPYQQDYILLSSYKVLFWVIIAFTYALGKYSASVTYLVSKLNKALYDVCWQRMTKSSQALL